MIVVVVLLFPSEFFHRSLARDITAKALSFFLSVNFTRIYINPRVLQPYLSLAVVPRQVVPVGAL